jgi:anaerobic selenocysteine-containing dehydrogenase
LGAILSAKVAAGKGSLDVNSGKLIVKRGKDFSPMIGNERVAIASACWQCVTRDSMIGYVEDDKLVKLEGHPNSIRGRGKICAKGQAGINQVYDPDRVLYPMRRVGKRGEGKWKRITWNAALDELASRLKKLSNVGHPEKFMFHYGRMTGSASKLIKDVFLASYGTKTIGDHTSICEGGKWTAQELTWGKHYDNWDFDNTRFVLNFGSNCLEAHTNHIPLAQRLVSAMAERRVKTITFDVRLSNTAARSTEWVPIKPGTDGAVVLAMCQVIMEEKLYDRDFLKFVKATKDHRASVDEKIAALKSHLFKYTPQWAEKISGVNALKTKSLAIEFARTKPAVVISYRGAIAHYNGNETERAIQMLSAITGNIDNPGGRCKAVSAEWSYPKGPKEKPKAKKLDIMDGFRGQVAYPTHHVSHQVLKMIKDGRAGRPEIYMWFCYNPLYANGEVQENIDILKDECLIPFTVCANAYYDESTALADLILPHPSYLELWDWEDMVSPAQIPEFYIRQPLVKPLGEARDLGDVVCELAKIMGFPLGFSSKEEFVRMSCELTPGVKEAGGFEYMKKYGVWHDPNAKPRYYSYKTEVEAANLAKDEVIFDEETGVYWNWQKSEAHSEEEAKEKGYTHTMDSYKGYVGQEIGEKVYVGFKPDKVNKSGYLELYSILLRKKGFAPLPTYLQIPEHQKIGSDELILTTYKVNVHTHSRTENCKWLTEIVHDNPAWINPKSADIKGIKTGDKIIVMSRTGKIETKAFVTEGVVPGVIAISHHLGHWGYGRYASGNKPPITEGSDPDLKLKWWTEHGVHPNWLIPNSPDPINGQQRWMDTVVKVTKA